jgi:hypothetical protein
LLALSWRGVSRNEKKLGDMTHRLGTTVLHNKAPELEEIDILVCEAEGADFGGRVDVGPGGVVGVVVGRGDAGEGGRKRSVAPGHDACKAIEEVLLALFEGGGLCGRL